MSAHIAASIPSYWIPAHVRAVVTPTGVVLLDLLRNRYFGLGAADASAMAALAENWAEASTVIQPLDAVPIELAAKKAVALSEAGLLSSTPADKPFAIQKLDRVAPLTCADSELQRAVPLRLSRVVDFARACLWAREATRSRTLYAIACEVSRDKRASSRSAGLSETVELVSVFRRLRPYAFQAKDQCLFHALALLRFLHLQGAHPTWIIAVRPKPWGAHSWLQVEECVLDCTPEEICGFTPILAV